jgi:hypothetical protein
VKENRISDQFIDRAIELAEKMNEEIEKNPQRLCGSEEKLRETTQVLGVS